MKRLLIAEDNAAIREGLTALLDETYEVLEAADGEAAMAILRQQPVDALVLDMLMPLMDGESVMRELARRRISVPVVVISAHRGLRAHGDALGAAESLAKPFAIEDLEAAIERAVARPTDASQGSGSAPPPDNDPSRLEAP